MRFLISVLYKLFFVGGLLILGTAALVFGPSTHPQETTLLVKRGDTAVAIGQRLEQERVVLDHRLFQIVSKIKGVDRHLKAGEYAFPPKASLFQVVSILRRGDGIRYSVTIPEGLTVKQVVALLNKQERLTGTIDVLPKEGTLLPDTYDYQRGDTRQKIIDRMKKAQEILLAELWPQKAIGLPIKTPQEALILASIVEKETAVADERYRVAGVFTNRLRRGMKLQTDPTVVYAITNGLGHMGGKRLWAKYLKVDNPYNTYKYVGLPPGPIANPGRAALEATLNPEQHDYIFFVADGTGGHAFAKTLKEHNRNVAEWRAHRKKAGK